ncbi:MAG: phosphoribosylaminoimidazole carboxylase ATPase subunit [Actinomycetota bacterium]|jgi:5-(carboxyamino)imidazole ribonucleotide synthase
MSTPAPVVPPAVIGMLGGGQLGRYALMAARTMGFGTIVLDPDPASPAGAVADRHIVAAFDDVAAIEELAAVCAVVTTEFENPPAVMLDRLAGHCRVAPSARAVAIAQDRVAEKAFLTDLGVPLAPWATIDGDPSGWSDPAACLPGIVKTARLGYDGRGQRAVVTLDDVVAAHRGFDGVTCVLERRLDLRLEVSVIVARSASGAVATYPVAENHHVDGILDLTVVPARIGADLAERATRTAVAVADGLDYVGVLAVEMFVVDGPDGATLLVNELAPRPHNSGHWTLDASATDQFSQQVRAVTGNGLGDTGLRHGAVAMVNLLGDLWSAGEPDWSGVLAEASAHLHLYGKAEARPGRKMGHLTLVGDDPDGVVERARHLRDALRRG